MVRLTLAVKPALVSVVGEVADGAAGAVVLARPMVLAWPAASCGSTAEMTAWRSEPSG